MSEAGRPRVEEAREATEALADALGRLIPQLSPHAIAPAAAELAEIVASPATRLLVARDSAGEIVGTLTVVLVRVPTGLRARVEDVVVDEAARGRGIGEALAQAAVALAREAGAKSVELTSRRSRAAAHALYRKLGFEERDTAVLRLDVAPPAPRAPIG